MAETTYKFLVQTSDSYKDAGTNSYVLVQLVGRDGKTKTAWRNLDVLFKDDFTLGATDEYELQMLDVGLPSILNIKLENWLKNDDEWLCNTIEVFRGEESVLFPIFTYIAESIEVLSGEAVLPQNETCEARKEVRELELVQNKATYPWITTGTPGLARYVHAETYDELPRLFKRYTTRQKDIVHNRLTGKFAAAIGVIKAKLHHVKELEDYRSYSKALTHGSRYYANWQSDESQGWQLLNGVSPLDFELCKKLPSHFNVTNDDVKRLLRSGKTLTDEMKDGRVYICDFTETYTPGNEMEYMPIGDGKKAFCAQAVALLYVNGNNKFVPISIQLKPHDRDYLFVSDNSDDWLLAKMYFRSAHLNTHEWVTHFLRTHLAMEPIAVSLFRCFSKAHPVYKLLRRHLSTVSAINAVGRTDLLPKTSAVAEGMSVVAISSVLKHYKTLDYGDLNIPRAMSKKGITVENIPEYWYGRDIVAVWKLIDEFCSSVIHIYYKTDKDILEDVELQDWARDLAWKGFAWEDGNTRGFPDKFERVEQLVEFCAVIIATNSVQHAAVNYGQFDNYNFSPNTPATMNLPPHKKGEANLERMLKSLPNDVQSAKSVAMAYGLSQFTEADEFIGTFKERWFTDKEVLKCQENFSQKILAYGKDIDRRNSQLEHKYTYLHPTRVPNAIAI